MTFFSCVDYSFIREITTPRPHTQHLQCFDYILIIYCHTKLSAWSQKRQYYPLTLNHPAPKRIFQVSRSTGSLLHFFSTLFISSRSYSETVASYSLCYLFIFLFKFVGIAASVFFFFHVGHVNFLNSKC